MDAMTARQIALGVACGLGCFALGLVAARFLGQTPAPPRPPPRIVIDPASIQLLPDASLRLDLPRGFDDAGL
jgi:hypothetical protein